MVTTLVRCLIGAGACSTIAYAGDGCPLPACVIEFDASYPNVGEECGAMFAGGVGCVIDFLPFCYNSGDFSYRVNEGARASISLTGDIIALGVFFANVEGSSGEMRFFNANRKQIGEPLLTNGECEVGAADILRLFGAWGPCADCEDCPADLSGDCVVGAADILLLLANWG